MYVPWYIHNIQLVLVRSLVVSLTLLFCDSWADESEMYVCDWMLDVAIELYCRIHCTQNRRSASAFSVLSRIHITKYNAPAAAAAYNVQWAKLMQHDARMMGNKHTELHTLDQMLCFSFQSHHHMSDRHSYDGTLLCVCVRALERVN